MTISTERLKQIRYSFIAERDANADIERPSYEEAIEMVDELLAVREAQSVPTGKFAGWGIYHAERDAFGSWLKSTPENDNSHAIIKHGYVNVKLYTAPHAVPDGYKLVPVDPTEEMIAAAFCVNFDNIYRAMLAAAPKAF